MTSTIGGTVVVEIVTGDVDCAFAEDLLTTYYQDPPTAPQGSGAYVDIGEWNCNSSSSQPPGRASTCRTDAGGEIFAHAPDGASTQPAAPPSSTAATPAAPSTSADSGGSCAQIDQPTLDQMFPDGVQDEAACRAYIGGENAVDTDR